MSRIKVFGPLSNDIRRGLRAQGTELQEKDLWRSLCWMNGFGRVQRKDLGIRIWLKPYGLVMENREQRDKRKGIS